MYIDAILDKKSDVVKVVERVDGKRVYKDHQVEHYFYVSDKDGKYKNIYKIKIVCPIYKKWPDNYNISTDVSL